jgi:hypothetical protein
LQWNKICCVDWHWNIETDFKVYHQRQHFLQRKLK